MKIFYKIELCKIFRRNWIKPSGLWHIYCVFADLKILGSLLYMGGAAEFFLK
jgi:hypothetical protein